MFWFVKLADRQVLLDCCLLRSGLLEILTEVHWLGPVFFMAMAGGDKDAVYALKITCEYATDQVRGQVSEAQPQTGSRYPTG